MSSASAAVNASTEPDPNAPYEVRVDMRSFLPGMTNEDAAVSLADWLAASQPGLAPHEVSSNGFFTIVTVPDRAAATATKPLLEGWQRDLVRAAA